MEKIKINTDWFPWNQFSIWNIPKKGIMANRGKYRFKKQVLKLVIETRKKKKEGDKYGK